MDKQIIWEGNQKQTYIDGFCISREYYDFENNINSGEPYKETPDNKIDTKDLKHHREDGPAHIFYFANGGDVSYEVYAIKGKVHRMDGPAVIEYYSDGNTEKRYYIDGNSYSKDSFLCKSLNHLLKDYEIGIAFQDINNYNIYDYQGKIIHTGKLSNLETDILYYL